MNSKTHLSREEIKALANEILFDYLGQPLSDAESVVVLKSYDGESYESMDGNGYHTQSLKDAGSKLFKQLSNALGKTINKKNFIQALERYKNEKMENSIHTPLNPLPPTWKSPWEQIKDKGERTQQMGPVLVKSHDALGMTRGHQSSPFEKSVAIKSKLKFCLDLRREGYLTLLEREPSEKVYCLCPSLYAPEQHLTNERTELPQSKTLHKSFEVDELGREEIIAIITPELPALEWLSESREKCLELNEEHLKGLLKCLKSTQEFQVYWMNYMVVN